MMLTLISPFDEDIPFNFENKKELKSFCNQRFLSYKTLLNKLNCEVLNTKRKKNEKCLNTINWILTDNIRTFEFKKDFRGDSICDTCGHNEADYIANPFLEDIEGIIEMEWICSDCYNDFCSDI